jgi:hypothetical protein
MKHTQLLLGAASLLAVTLTPNHSHACACGCGVFEVGGSAMLPSGAGGMAFLEYDYQNQNRNWSGSSHADDANNDDKKIETHFVTLGVQYMFNRSWGAQVEVPFANRTFDSAANAGSVNWSGLGDIRLKGIYTGFSEDLSTGLTLGLKLPSGSYSHSDPLGDIDRDTQIGSGSTDLLVGGFHRGHLWRTDKWDWFAQAQLDLPVAKQGDYRPGMEVDAAVGVYYQGWTLHGVKISPVAQVIVSDRMSDGGTEAAPDDSGYQRVLLSPGVEFNFHPVKVYADVELPVYEHVNGNQLVAPALFKVVVSYMF